MAMRYIAIFILLFSSSSCKSHDQLTHAKPLTHGDVFISNGGGFALGFFSPTSSNASLYLGIWYNNIPGPRTIVWVANRDNPITNTSSPMLAITNSSDLVLSDSQGGTPWAVKNAITSAGATAVRQCCSRRGTWSSNHQMVRSLGRVLIIQPTQFFQT
jgi:hypothetical protein